MKSQIEVKRYVFRGWAVALASLVVSTMAHLSYCQRLTTPNQTQRVINDLIVAGEFLFPLSITQLYNSKLRAYVKYYFVFFEFLFSQTYSACTDGHQINDAEI